MILIKYGPYNSTLHHYPNFASDRQENSIRLRLINLATLDKYLKVAEPLEVHSIKCSLWTVSYGFELYNIWKGPTHDDARAHMI